MKLAVQEAQFKISGMSCGHCKSAVEKALANLQGVSRVEVFLEEGLAVVEFDPARVEVADLKKEIEETGYTVV